jgi:hypothetical protein
MAYWLIVIAVLFRFVPHVHNFSPVYGALLFGGAHLKKRDAIWFPVVLLAASDIVLTNLIYHLNIGWLEIVQMAAFASIALTGELLRNRPSWRLLLGACLASSVFFFLISNFGVWLGWNSYPHTWWGLVDCYVAAIPWYRQTLISTFVYSALFFGCYEIYAARHRSSGQVELR